MDFDITKLELSLGHPTLELPDPDTCLWWNELEKRDLWLTGDFEWCDVDFIVRYIKYLNKTESDNLSPITLHIMSHGGTLEALFSLYNTIKESKIPVNTVNEGIAASAAFIVFLAGEKRTMNKYGHFVAHEGSAMMGGTSRETKAAMQQYEIEIDTMAGIVAENTKLTKEEVVAKYDAVSDWYIRYDEALATGIVTE